MKSVMDTRKTIILPEFKALESLNFRLCKPSKPPDFTTARAKKCESFDAIFPRVGDNCDFYHRDGSRFNNLKDAQAYYRKYSEHHRSQHLQSWHSDFRALHKSCVDLQKSVHELQVANDRLHAILFQDGVLSCLAQRDSMVLAFCNDMQQQLYELTDAVTSEVSQSEQILDIHNLSSI